MGWGIVEGDSGGLRLVAYGALTTPPKLPMPERLRMLYQGLTALLEEHRPEAAAVEELFFSKNVTTALAVGQARGVALLALANAGLKVHEYKPMEVKQAISGYGRADKPQMQEMVRMTLELDHIPQPDDAADALAIAMCHAYSAPLRQRLQEGE